VSSSRVVEGVTPAAVTRTGTVVLGANIAILPESH